MEAFYCKTCPFWTHEPAHTAMKAPEGGIIAAAGTSLNVRLGWCRGDPPDVVMIPVVTQQGPRLDPAFPDPLVREDRPGCHHHPIWNDMLARNIGAQVRGRLQSLDADTGPR
jgi:hypothetical protein